MLESPHAAYRSGQATPPQLYLAGEAAGLPPPPPTDWQQHSGQPEAYGWAPEGAGTAADGACYHQEMPSLPGWSDYSIPANWGQPAAGGVGTADYGHADGVNGGGWVAVTWPQPSEACSGMLAPAAGGLSPQAYYALSPQQQYEQHMLYQQHQHLQHMQMQMQQAYGQGGPAFVISPPQPRQPQGQQGQGRLARKKKAAMPAEASFGCDSSCLGGDNSAVLLPSAEASQEGQAARDAAESSGQQQQQPQESSASSPSAAAAAAAAAAGQCQRQPPSIEYDKAPRPVEWRPYSFAEYRQRNYDSKQQAKYWQVSGGWLTQRAWVARPTGWCWC
jgi:hypothetical protein